MASSAKSEYWQGLLDQFQQSGQTVQTFCTEKGVSVPSFYQWKRRLRGEVAASSGIVPVRFLPEPRRAASDSIQIVTPNGFVVRVDSSMSAESLAQLLRTVAAAST